MRWRQPTLRPAGTHDWPGWPPAVLAAVALQVAVAAGSQIVADSRHVTHVKLGPNATCPPASTGYTLLCFDPDVPVPFGAGLVAFVSATDGELALRDRLTGETRLRVTPTGTTVVGDAPAAPRTGDGIIVAGRAFSNTVSGIWSVTSEVTLYPDGGRLQTVCLVGTAYCGTRFVAVDAASAIVLLGTYVVVDDGITAELVLAALAEPTPPPIISRWSIYAAQARAEMVVTVNVSVDGSVQLLLSEFASPSVCGSTLARQQTFTDLPLGECISLTSSLRAVFNATLSHTHLYVQQCPAIGSTSITGLLFTHSPDCSSLSFDTTHATLGTCTGSGRYLLSCVTSQ